MGRRMKRFADGLLEYPQYTRPREFRGMAVPDVLLERQSCRRSPSGGWSRGRQRTKERRPDLWQAYLKKDIERDEADK